MKKKTLTMAFTMWVLVAVFLMVGMAWQADAAVVGPTNITIKHACISMPDGAITAPIGIPAVSCPAGTIKMWLPADNTAVAPETGLLAPGSFVINAAEGDNLTITVANELAIPVSLTIPGQVLSNNTGPVWLADIALPYTSTTATGSRPTPANASDPEDPAYKYRVRSFAHEVPPGLPGAPGAPTTYTWNNLKPGTYLILSGTHPSLQVQMGIYGMLIVKTVGGSTYAGIAAPAQEANLLFSEIDPAIHAAADDSLMVAAPPTIPSTNDYKPKYFLINGKAFPAGDPIPIGAAGSITLLRFANAGLDTYVPLLQGQYMQVIAEDGYVKTANLRFNRYSIDLHAGKTFDALLTNPAAGYIPLYDRRLYLSNAANAPGGMMAYLEVGGPGNNLLTVTTNGGNGTGKVRAASLPGGIYCDSSVAESDCTQQYFTGTSVKLMGQANAGSSLSPIPNGWIGCDTVTAANECLVTMSTSKNVTASFVASATPQPSRLLTLRRPNSGRVRISKPYRIRWRFTKDPGSTVLIELLQNNQFVTTIANAAPAGTPNARGRGRGFFDWTIVPAIPTGTGYQVRITSNADPTMSDISNRTFRIIP